MKIGIYGGTFDPIHDGHIYVANRAIESEQLSKVIFVPNNQSPLKIEKALFTNEERLNKISEKLVNDRNKYLDTVQIFNTKPSYTIDLIHYYSNKLNYNDELFYIMGSDALLEFDQYFEWQEILKYIKLIVIKRPGFEPCGFLTKYPEYGNRISTVGNPYTQHKGYEISSTEIREKIKKEEENEKRNIENNKVD